MKNRKLEKFLENGKELGKWVLDFSLSLPTKTALLSTLHYYIPTAVRMFRESKGPSMDSEPLSDIISPFSAIALDVGQLAFYSENPKYLAIPLVTNIASGIYEYYRDKRGIENEHK